MLSEFDITFHLKEIAVLISTAQRRYNQIVMLWGGTRQDRSSILKACADEHGLDYLSLGLDLSALLIKTPEKRRALIVADHFEALLKANKHQGVALDHIEILFQSDLKLNPLAFVQRFTTNKLMLISWPGRVENSQFVYAEPSHPEFYQEPVSDVLRYSLEVNE